MKKFLAQKIDELSRSKFIYNIVLTGISLGLYGLTKVAFNIIVLKFYDSALVGAYNLAISGALLVSILISNLFCISLTKFSAEALGKDRNDEFLFFINVNFWALLVLSMVCAAVFYWLSPWIASEFGGDAEKYRWASWIILLSNIYNYFKSFSYVVEKVLRYTVLEIISSIIFFGSLITVLVMKKESLLLLPMLLQLGFFSVYSLIVNWKYISDIHWIVHFRQYGRQAVDLLKYSLITGLGTTASMWTTHLFTMMLGKYADVRSVGYFSVINSAVDPLNFVPRVLTMVSFPRISYLFGKEDYKGLGTFIRRNFIRLMYICVALLLVTMFFSHYVTVMLFTDNIIANDWLLKLMMIGRLIGIVSVFHIALLSGTKYPAIPNLTGPLALVVCLPLIPILYPGFGLIGVGFIIILSSILRSLPSLLYGEKILRSSFNS